MSYALGQAKLMPGQISFATTRTGKIRTVQPLLEAGLPIAPYIEHGSWVTGEPNIMRYGRDPYRGLGQQETVTEAGCRRRRLMVGTGVLVGAAAGAVGGLLGKTLLGGLLGAVGGGLLGYMSWQKTSDPVTAREPETSLSGVLAVL
jgi:hypothetical protein